MAIDPPAKFDLGGRSIVPQQWQTVPDERVRNEHLDASPESLEAYARAAGYSSDSYEQASRILYGGPCECVDCDRRARRYYASLR